MVYENEFTVIHCDRVAVCEVDVVRLLSFVSLLQVWITAEKQGVIAGIYFWPGSEVEIEGRRPHYYYKYKE